MPPIRPRRSVLYVPADQARALEKARELPADALILDLEDAVAPEHKESARRRMMAAMAKGFPGKEVFIRINGLATKWGITDLTAAAACWPQAILLPKVETLEDMKVAEAGLADHDPERRIMLAAMIETPRAILNLYSIAAHAAMPGARLAGLVLGLNDLAMASRVALTPDRQAFLPWMMQLIAGARAFNLFALDGVYNALDDEKGFRQDCLVGRALGFDGKTLVHPCQITLANTVFAPTDEEIAFARAVIAAFAAPENAGRGVLRVEGRMVEHLHARQAAEILALQAAIRSGGRE